MTKDEEKERRWNKEMTKDEERRKDKIENEIKLVFHLYVEKLKILYENLENGKLK